MLFGNSASSLVILIATAALLSSGAVGAMEKSKPAGLGIGTNLPDLIQAIRSGVQYGAAGHAAEVGKKAKHKEANTTRNPNAVPTGHRIVKPDRTLQEISLSPGTSKLQ